MATPEELRAQFLKDFGGQLEAEQDIPAGTGDFAFLNPTKVERLQSNAAGQEFGTALNEQADIVRQITSNLRDAKEAIKRGELTFSEYIQGVEGLTRLVNNGLSSVASGRPGVANELKRELGTFFAIDAQGKFLTDPKIPFNQREVQNLPTNVLPSLEDIDQGRIPVDLLPGGTRELVQRTEQQAVTEQPPTAPVEPITPVTPPTDGTQPLVPQQPITEVPDPTQPGQTIPVPIVGETPGITPPQTADQSLIEAEARRQDEQERQAFFAARGLREQGLQRTEQLLGQQRRASFEQFIPQAAEQLQTRGLLQTSELENVLGREQGRLQQQAEIALGGARVAGTQEEINAINRILAERQGLQQAGVERRFSLEDFDRQLRAARELGSEVTPTVGQQGGGSRLGSTAAGGLAGAAALSGLGPGGALVGGALGAFSGSQQGGGK